MARVAAKEPAGVAPNSKMSGDYDFVPRFAISLLYTVFIGFGTLAIGAGKEASGNLDVGGSKIYYETRGSGPAIVLLHDGLLSSVTWDEVWQQLTSKYEVIRYDRRGYGRSELPTGSYSSTEDLLKLLSYLNVQQTVLVGSSSGGALAIDFAIEHPWMVDGLFLIGPVLHGMQYTEQFRERANRNNEPMQRDDIKAVARNWSEDKYLIAGPNEKARSKIYDSLIGNAGKLKFDNRFEQQLSPPASGRLAEIKTPTFILEGDADMAGVHAHGDAIKAGVSESTLEVVKGAGHLVQLEKPDEVVKRLEEFQKELKR